MKYCIEYNKNKDSKYLDKVDEININFDKVESIDALIKFCQKHEKQRINICLSFENYSIDKLKSLLPLKQDNLYIRIPHYQNQEELDFLLTEYPDARIYFETKINNWSLLTGYLDYGVTDVYITEGLGFELDKVAKVVHEKGAQVRVFPNVAQSNFDRISDLKKFWIRPEDLKQYEPYVDVCEFYQILTKFDIYYDIYKKDKKWMGNLSEIIIGLKEPLDSQYIVPRFVKKRIRCGRECMKGGKCRMCEHIIELSHNLEKAKLIVTMKEDKNKEEEE